MTATRWCLSRQGEILWPIRPLATRTDLSTSPAWMTRPLNPSSRARMMIGPTPPVGDAITRMRTLPSAGTTASAREPAPVLGSSSDVARVLPGRAEELPVASGHRVRGGGALQPRHRGRRVLLPARAQRVRQDDGAQDARVIRGSDRGTDRDGRAPRDRREPRPRGGLPGRRLAVWLAHGRRERRVWAADGWCREGGAA